MPRKNKYGDICQIGKVELDIELIILPKETKGYVQGPAINRVQYNIKTATKTVILHVLDFDTEEKARKWFETVKEAFVR